MLVGAVRNFRGVLSLLLSLPFLGVAMTGTPIGLVLSGGAAKGAYEVGVWQELVECGLSGDVSAISGTSVGAINAAFFAAGIEPEKCTRLWEEEINGIFQFNTNLVVNVMGEEGKHAIDRVYAKMRKNIAKDMADAAAWRRCGVTELPHEVKDEIIERCESVARKRLFLELPKLKAVTGMLCDYDDSRPTEGFLSIDKLYSLVLRELPHAWRSGCPAVYATALLKGKENLSIVTFPITKERPQQRASMICASSCLPVLFGTYEVNGSTYIDGGIEMKGGDNVPIGAILDNHPDIKTIIVVFLDDEDHIRPWQRNRVRNAAQAAGVRPVEVIPSRDIDGTFGVLGYVDDSKDTVRRLIELGRKDAREALAKAKMLKK